MKKIAVMAVFALASAGAFSGPCGCPGFRPVPPPPPFHPHPMHHPGGGWGRGGCNFWPGFIGGVVGGAVASTIVRSEPVVVTQPVVTTPVVVAQPVVMTPTAVTTSAVVTQPVVVAPATQVQNVWVEGRYVDQVQANGAVIRSWQPGHYEQRTVVLQ